MILRLEERRRRARRPWLRRLPWAVAVVLYAAAAYLLVSWPR